MVFPCFPLGEQNEHPPNNVIDSIIDVYVPYMYLSGIFQSFEELADIFLQSIFGITTQQVP